MAAVSAYDSSIEELKLLVNNCKQLHNSCETKVYELTRCHQEMTETNRTIAELEQRQDLNSSERIEIFRQQQNNSLAYYNQTAAELDKIVNQIVPSIQKGIQQAQNSRQLLRQELNGWEIEQRMAQTGPRMDASDCYQKLASFEPKFEVLGSLLKGLLEAWELCLHDIQSISGPTVDQIKDSCKLLDKDIRKCMCELSESSVVMARQPPTFLIPGRPKKTEQERGMRHPCVPVLRILGGKHLGLRDRQDTTVTCKIISEESARKMFAPESGSNKNYKPKEVGTMLSNQTIFQSLPGGAYQAAFKSMQLVRFADDKETGIPRPRRRYYLLFELQLVGTHFKSNLKLLSLPLGIFANLTQRFDHGGDAFLWWQLAFCEGNGVLCPQAPDRIAWDRAIDALCRKFRQLIDEPTEPCHNNSFGPPPAALSDTARAHLAERANKDGYLTWDTFFKEKNLEVCRRYNARNGSEVAATFREWFYACGRMVNRYLQPQWNNNRSAQPWIPKLQQILIIGFVSTNTAMQLVSADPSSSKMLIRFADSNVDYLMIAYFYPGLAEAQQFSLVAEKLKTVDFTEVLRHKTLRKHVHYIYANVPKDALLCGLEPRSKKAVTGLAHFGYVVTNMELTIRADEHIADEPQSAEDVLVNTNDEDQEMPDDFYDFDVPIETIDDLVAYLEDPRSNSEPVPKLPHMQQEGPSVAREADIQANGATLNSVSIDGATTSTTRNLSELNFYTDSVEDDGHARMLHNATYLNNEH